MRKYEKGEIAKIILQVLAGGALAGGLAFTFAAAPGWAYIFKLFDAKKGKEQARIRQSIQGLARKRFVRIHTKHGKEFLVLTGEGKRAAYWHYLDTISLESKKKKKWDGLWRVIIFDISEEKRYARDALHRKLKEIGFYPLQKSVFVFPYECRDEINFIAQYFDVLPDLYYITAKKIEQDKILRKEFAL